MSNVLFLFFPGKLKALQSSPSTVYLIPFQLHLPGPPGNRCNENREDVLLYADIFLVTQALE